MDNGTGENVHIDRNWIEPTTTSNGLVVREFTTNVEIGSNIIVSHPKPQG